MAVADVRQFPGGAPLQVDDSAGADPRQDLAHELISNIDRVKDLLNAVLGSQGEVKDERTVALERRVLELEGERQRLIDELGELYDQHDRLMGVYVASYQLHTSLDPQKVQRTIAEIAINLLGAEAFALLLRRDQTGGCEIAFAEGAGDFLGDDPSHYHGGDPLIDATLEDGELRLQAMPGSRAVAAVPLKIDNRPVGALVIYRLLGQKVQLRDADRDLLDLLAAHSATALVVSRIYARTTRKLKTIEGLMSLGDDGGDGDDEQSGDQRSAAFSGNLEDLPVVDLVQFIHYNSRTGTLVLRRSGQSAQLVFSDGRLIAATTPDEVGLGERLVETGVIKRAELEEVNAQSLSSNVAAGALLPQSGRVPLDALIGTARQQVEESTQALLQWNDGQFEFRLGEVETAPLIGLPPDILLANLFINAQRLLLDALRLKDERERNEPGAAAVTASPATPPAPAPVEESSDAGNLEFISQKAIDEMFERVMRKQSKRRSPERIITSAVTRELRSVFESVRVSMATSSLAVNLLDLVAKAAERGILFVVRGRELIPIGAFGQTPNGKPLTSQVGAQTIMAESGAAARALTAGRAQFVTFEESGFPADLLERIGRPTTGQVAILPIVGSKAAILVAYADAGDQEQGLEGLDVLDLLATPIGLAIENELLRRKLASSR